MWRHVSRTTLIPPSARLAVPAIVVVATIPGTDVVVGAAPITQAMFDQNEKRIGCFELSTARANSVLLQALQSRDSMATMSLPTTVDKRDKLTTDFVAVSLLTAANSRSQFYNFKMRDGDAVL